MGKSREKSSKKKEIENIENSKHEQTIKNDYNEMKERASLKIHGIENS